MQSFILQLSIPNTLLVGPSVLSICGNKLSLRFNTCLVLMEDFPVESTKSGSHHIGPHKANQLWVEGLQSWWFKMNHFYHFCKIALQGRTQYIHCLRLEVRNECAKFQMPTVDSKILLLGLRWVSVPSFSLIAPIVRKSWQQKWWFSLWVHTNFTVHV